MSKGKIARLETRDQDRGRESSVRSCESTERDRCRAMCNQMWLIVTAQSRGNSAVT